MITKRYIIKTWNLSDTPFWSNVSDNFPSFTYIDNIFYPKGIPNNTINVNVSSFFSFQSFSENITFTAKTSEYGYLSILDTLTNFEMFYFISELQKPLQDGIMFKLDKDIYMTYTIPVLRQLLASNKKLLFNRHHVETKDIAYYEDDLFINAPIANTSFSLLKTPIVGVSTSQDHPYISTTQFAIKFPLPLSATGPNIPLLNRYYVFFLDGDPISPTEFDNKYLLIPVFYNNSFEYETTLNFSTEFYTFFAKNSDINILKHFVNNKDYTNFFIGVFFLEPLTSMTNPNYMQIAGEKFLVFSIPFSGMSIDSYQPLIALQDVSRGSVYYNWSTSLQSNYLYNFYNFRFYDFFINVSKLMQINGDYIYITLNPNAVTGKKSFFNIGTNGVHIMDTTSNQYENNIIEFPYMLPSSQSGYKKYIAANLENTNTSYTTFQQKTLINGSMDLAGGILGGFIGGALNPSSIPESVAGVLNTGINTGLSINHTRRQIQSEYSTAKRTSIPTRLTSINNSLKHMLYYTDTGSPLTLPFLPIYRDDLNENSITILNNLFYLYGFYNPQYMTFSDMFRLKRDVRWSTYFEIDKGSFSRFIANYDYTQAIGIREYYNHIVNMVSEGIRFWDEEPNRVLFRQPYNKSTALIVVDNGK